MLPRTQQCTYRVIYGDTDQMGVVYYANYLRFFERGRTEFLRAEKIAYARWEKGGFFLPVVDARIRYHQPARFEDLLYIETSLVEVRRVRLKFEYQVWREDADQQKSVLATGETMHACIDGAGKPTRLPEDILHLTA